VQARFQENVSDPILKALQKLVESLHEAIKKVQNVDWDAKYQKGMTSTNEVWSQAVTGARESFNVCKENVKEIPFDQVLRETSEGFKSALEGIGSYAKEVAGELAQLKIEPLFGQQSNQQNVAPAAPAKDASGDASNETPNETSDESSNEMMTEENTEVVVNADNTSDAGTESSSDGESANAPSDEVEWEQVNAAAATPTEEVASTPDNSVETNANVAIQSYDGPYANECQLIRDIFPNCSAARAVSLLERAGGNVELVLNHLAEN
jgi:hypothetical protein